MNETEQPALPPWSTWQVWSDDGPVTPRQPVDQRTVDLPPDVSYIHHIRVYDTDGQEIARLPFTKPGRLADENFVAGSTVTLEE